MSFTVDKGTFYPITLQETFGADGLCDTEQAIRVADIEDYNYPAGYRERYKDSGWLKANAIGVAIHHELSGL